MTHPSENATQTKIVGGTIIAHAAGRHCLLENGVVVYAGDRILHVGRHYDGPAARIIDARDMLVMPGLISTHAHVDAGEATRLLLDGGRRDFMRNGFPNFVPTKGPNGRSFFQSVNRADSLRFALAQLLRNGVTCALAFDPHGDDLLVDLAGDIGIRLYTAPWASAGRYHFDGEGRLCREWDEAAGLRALERTAAFIERHRGRHDGRIQGIVVINEFYNATPPLLRAAKRAAEALGVGLTMHFCEQLFEFHQTVRSTGRTPVQVLADHGILGPELILAHALYLTGHSLTGYPYGDDLAPLAHAGTSVAHSPLVFARRGVALESFDRYAAKGINMALGTDTFPMDLFEEMRTASTVCKLIESNHEAAPAQAVFNAATLGGAKALRRDDLGRLAPGAKADIVILDAANLWLGPIADPLRALIACGHGSMVETVIVDGRMLVEGGRLVNADAEAVLRGARASARAAWEAYPQWHWAGRTVAQEFPPSLPAWTAD